MIADTNLDFYAQTRLRMSEHSRCSCRFITGRRHRFNRNNVYYFIVFGLGWKGNFWSFFGKLVARNIEYDIAPLWKLNPYVSQVGAVWVWIVVGPSPISSCHFMGNTSFEQQVRDFHGGYVAGSGWRASGFLDNMLANIFGYGLDCLPVFGRDDRQASLIPRRYS